MKEPAENLKTVWSYEKEEVDRKKRQKSLWCWFQNDLIFLRWKEIPAIEANFKRCLLEEIRKQQFFLPVVLNVENN